MKSKCNFTTSLPTSVVDLIDRVARDEQRKKNEIVAEAVLLWNRKRLAAKQD